MTDIMKSFADAEKAMLALPQVDCPIVSYFAPGIYVREMHVPSGTFLLGHHHKESHICMLLSGKIEVFDGGKTTILEAPAIFNGSPGRKIGFAIEDVIFSNIHANPTNETDLDKLADLFVVKSEEFKLVAGGNGVLK
jgi:hypothetical protein